MIKQSKMVYIIGSIIIGIVSIILIFAGLVLSGLIDARSVKLVYSTGSKEALYDGTELTCDEWELVSGELKKGHTAKVSVVGKRTDAGSSANTLSVVITDLNGADVTSDYSIEVQTGTLQVNPRPITIQTGSASKYFDGEPLTCDTWELVSLNNIVAGDVLEVKVIGTQTTEGVSENTADVRVLRGEEDVSYNYEITCQAGQLLVRGESTGSELGGGLPENDGVVAKLYADTSGIVYLRLKSDGKYDGGGFDAATSYSGTLNDTMGMNYLTGMALAQMGKTKSSIRIEPSPSLAGYVLPYYLSTDDLNYEKQTDDVAYIGFTDEAYSVYFYMHDVLADGAITAGNLGEYTLQEQAYREYVYTVDGQYLALPESTRTYMDGIIAEQGWSLTDSDIVKKIAKYIKQSATYTKKYDSQLDKEDDIVVAFLQTYKKGLCRHYAAAATALYRAIGIPARYTVGYAVAVKANEVSYLERKDAHAWVEIYLDGIGWVAIDATAADPDGNVGVGGGLGDMGGESEDFGNLEDLGDLEDLGKLDQLLGDVLNGMLGSGSSMAGGMPGGAGGVGGGSGVIGEYDSSSSNTTSEDSAASDSDGTSEGGGSGGTSGDGSGSGSGDGSGEISGDGSGDGSGEISGDGSGSGSGEISGDGSGDISGGTSSGGSGLEDGSGSDKVDMLQPVARIYTNKNGKIYLRLKSDGFYNGKGFDAASSYNVLLESTYGMNYLTGTALQNYGRQPYTVQIKPLNGISGYILPYYIGTQSGANVQISDVYNIGNFTEEYTVTAYDYNYRIERIDLTGLLESYSQQEEAYRQYVYTAEGQYLALPQDTLTYMKKIILKEGFTLDDPNVVNKVAYYIQNAATYNLKYNVAMDQEDDVIVAFLGTYKEGVCRHYAAAATALYRALGIPARYTVGYAVDAVAGEETEVTIGDGHAWVEIYLDGIGWVHVEVTGGGVNGGLGNPGLMEDSSGGSNGDSSDMIGSGGISGSGEIGSGEISGGGLSSGSGSGESSSGGLEDGSSSEEEGLIMTEPLKFVAQNRSKMYDGTPLVASNTLADSSKATLLYLQNNGYEVTYDVNGSQTEVGKSEATVENIVIKKDGVDYTHRFIIRTAPGTLHVYLYEVTITTGSASKIYDGTRITNDEYTDTGVLAGHTLSVQFTVNLVNVGKVNNSVKVTIVDSETNENFTDSYKINTVLGTLEITPRPITVISKDATQYYDKSNPKPLKLNDGYVLTDGGSLPLAEGHIEHIECTGSQTNIGSSENKFTVKISTETGEDVTSNYFITKKYGTLQVLPPLDSQAR